MSFNYTHFFLIEVPAIYHCVITSTVLQWEVNGNVSGANSFGTTEGIRHTLPVGDSFTATKTALSVSTLLLMLSLTIVWLLNVMIKLMVIVILTVDNVLLS